MSEVWMSRTFWSSKREWEWKPFKKLNHCTRSFMFYFISLVYMCIRLQCCWSRSVNKKWPRCSMGALEPYPCPLSAYCKVKITVLKSPFLSALYNNSLISCGFVAEKNTGLDPRGPLPPGFMPNQKRLPPPPGEEREVRYFSLLAVPFDKTFLT